MKYLFLFLLLVNFNLLAESPVAELTLTSKSEYYQEDSPLQLAVNFQLNPGWHIYYKEPGKFGLPTTMKIITPEKFAETSWDYPAPQKFEELTKDVTAGYEKEVSFTAEIVPEYAFKRNLDFQVNVKWLACNQEQCVPGQQTLVLSLPYRK